MKTVLLFTGRGPILIVTSHNTITDHRLVERLRLKSIGKFIGYEVPTELAKERYGEHFHIVMTDQHETDGLRVLDDDGQRVFERFHFSEFGPPIFHEGTGPPIKT